MEEEISGGTEKHWEQGEEKAANVYAAVQAISNRLKEGQITVVGNGSACVVGGHAQIIKRDRDLSPTQQWLPWDMTFRQPSVSGLLPERTARTAWALPVKGKM